MDEAPATTTTVPVPSEPTVYGGSGYTTLPAEMRTGGGDAEKYGVGEAVQLRVDRWFPGLKVRYRLYMRDGVQEFTAVFPEGQTQVTQYYRWDDLVQYDPQRGRPPYFQGITGVEWDGGQRTCPQDVIGYPAPGQDQAGPKPCNPDPSSS